MFPVAVSVGAQVDKQVVALSATTHVDNLEAFYKIFRDTLLDPGWCFIKWTSWCARGWIRRVSSAHAIS